MQRARVTLVFSIEPAGWVEDQDVSRWSNDSSVARTSSAPASKSKKETAWRPAIRASQAEQIRRRKERPCRSASVEEPLHLLLHLRSKQGVEPDNPPEAKC